MAPHSSTLAWKIPQMEEPGRPQSMGSLGVGHDWATSLSLLTFMHWRRKWQPSPVFLPGESQGWWSLVGCHLWGCTESDTTEVTQQQQRKYYWTTNGSKKNSKKIPWNRWTWYCKITNFMEGSKNSSKMKVDVPTSRNKKSFKQQPNSAPQWTRKRTNECSSRS